MAYFYSPEIANAMDEERILNVTSRGSGKTSVVTPLPVVAFTSNAVVTFSMLIVFSPQSLGRRPCARPLLAACRSHTDNLVEGIFASFTGEFHVKGFPQSNLPFYLTE